MLNYSALVEKYLREVCNTPILFPEYKGSINQIAKLTITKYEHWKTTYGLTQYKILAAQTYNAESHYCIKLFSMHPLYHLEQTRNTDTHQNSYDINFRSRFKTHTLFKINHIT